jgi:diguanylate cyclase (GGDEF)-like protein
MRLGEGLLNSGTMLALFAPDDSLNFATSDFLRLYDVQPGRQTFDSIMRHCYTHKTGALIETDDIEAWLAAANAKRRSRALRKFEVDMVDGRWMYAIETLFDDDWILVAVTDFTAVKYTEFTLRTARDEAIAASETDHLTGLFNRGAAMKRFGSILERAVQAGQDFSIVLIDLDHFKMINDHFGHDGGDQVLVHFAGCTREVLRDRDVVGRVGGEEFLFVMPGASISQASAGVERLRAYLRDQRLKVGDVTLRYTFSAGIAGWQAGKSLESLYKDADQALYAAKSAGRDQARNAV